MRPAAKMGSKKPDTESLSRAQRLAKWTKRAFTENAAIKFVAFVLALTIFILVHSDNDVQAKVSVRLEVNPPEEDRILVSEIPPSILITVKGTRRRTRRFDAGDLRPIVVDLVNHRRSEYVFTPDLIGLPEGLELVRFTPPSILTEFEPRVERSVPIEVPRKGNVPPGYVVAGMSPTPTTVMVSGPQSLVEAMDGVKTTRVSLTGKTASFAEQVSLVPPHSLVQIGGAPLVESDKVRVDVAIVEEHASKKVSAQKLKIRGHPDVSPKALSRISAEPAEVEVWLRGARLAVDAVDPKDLEVFVEVSPGMLSSGRSRQARVVVTRPAPGVAIEVRPQEVTLHMK